METVEVVVKIPKGSFEFWQKVKQTKEVRIGYWETAISDGILLPKNHGRLIDADKVLDFMRDTFDMQELYLPIHFKELVIDEIPTIVDAEVENDD